MEVYLKTLKGESPEYELTFKNRKVCHFKNEPLRDIRRLYQNQEFVFPLKILLNL